ncbi:dUTP diphosphatase [Jeotgalibaca porci]|uniref:dUTP diphosphatase n=1 Tax=Jeotgalibaca porci TaxID=1868793 RepID=UPI00359F25BD
MNLKKLQAMQAKLDEAILVKKTPMTEEERFNKTLVALSVEIAEIANCAEHFKFWKDNKGKIDRGRFSVIHIFHEEELVEVEYTEDSTGIQYTDWEAYKLTLVEECSDALHFILSLANQVDFEINGIGTHFKIADDVDSLEKNFLFLNHVIGLADFKHFHSDLEMIIDVFFIYINQLGITTKELEQAYYDKNKINYERLENGY